MIRNKQRRGDRAYYQWKSRPHGKSDRSRRPSPARALLEYELKETERLNAMIVKQTRHCAELKAWEEAEEARRKT
jgi:hypothetical protein